ncbi:MAG: hypothetical protein R2706_18290 [Acidimicrobiales bacterium]
MTDNHLIGITRNTGDDGGWNWNPNKWQITQDYPEANRTIDICTTPHRCSRGHAG